MSGLIIDDPVRLSVVLSSNRVLPGDTLLLRGGTYAGLFVSTIAGTTERPITIKPYNNERVIIDGRLTINGAHTHWYDIEKRYSGGTRETQETGSFPAIEAGRLELFGEGTKLINCLIYDQVTNGIAWWSAASGGELYGCVIFDNGWLAPDRGHGHNIYTQNGASNGIKTIKHCILAQCFAGANNSTNLAQFASGGVANRHYRMIECIMIEGTQLIGAAEIDDWIMDGCHIWGDLLIGYSDDNHNDIHILNTRISGGCNISFMRNYTLQNSMIVSPTGDVTMLSSQEPAAGVIAYTSTGNAYHYLGTKPKPFFVETVGYFSFDEWKARYSTDSDSAYLTSPPTTNSVHVYPNEYKARRGNIVVWNWEGLNAVNVNVSTVLAAGANYRLRNVMDYFGDVVEGVVPRNQIISVDMQAASHSVSVPDGWNDSLIETTFPAFGAFVLEQA